MAKAINWAALYTLPQAWRTRIANASNNSVKHECWPAQGTVMVLVPHAEQWARGVRAPRRVSRELHGAQMPPRAPGRMIGNRTVALAFGASDATPHVSHQDIYRLLLQA